MPNDISEFKVIGDDTIYQFNDPDVEGRITAEATRALAAEQSLANDITTKVSKAGDTMTGFLRMKSENITDGETPSSTAWGNGFSGRDSGGSTVIMQVQPVDYASGGKYIYLSRSATYNGTRKTAILHIGFDGNGNDKVLVSNAAAWRDAIGVKLSTKTLTNQSTNGYGEIQLGLATSAAAVLATTTVGGNNFYICIPFVYNSNWYIRVLDNSGNRLASVNVGDVKVYYIAL